MNYGGPCIYCFSILMTRPTHCVTPVQRRRDSRRRRRRVLRHYHHHHAWVEDEKCLSGFLLIPFLSRTLLFDKSRGREGGPSISSPPLLSIYSRVMILYESFFFYGQTSKENRSLFLFSSKVCKILTFLTKVDEFSVFESDSFFFSLKKIFHNSFKQ